jgi:hypothetical protein
MTEMIFDSCQRLGGYVWGSRVVRELIVERWQTIFSVPSTIILEHLNFNNNLSY